MDLHCTCRILMSFSSFSALPSHEWPCPVYMLLLYSYDKWYCDRLVPVLGVFPAFDHCVLKVPADLCNTFGYIADKNYGWKSILEVGTEFATHMHIQCMCCANTHLLPLYSRNNAFLL